MRAELLCLALLLPLAASANQVDVLRQSGPPSKRIDIVILGDGYRTQDQAQLNTDAQNLMTSLFNNSPWKEYQALFNVRLIHVVSNQNGADNGTYGATRDTALGAYFNCSGIDRLLCVNASAVYPILSADAPDYDIAMVVVNDPKYGGSGGSIPTTSINASSGEIVIHEIGHSVGGLTDEYESPYPGYPACGTDCPEANATRNATSTVKWSAWIPNGTPIPTPENDASYMPNIGVFEGGRFMSTGVFRPKDTNCKMRVLGGPNCSVCSEQLVKSFWNRMPSMFDAVSPANSNVSAVCGSVNFSVVPVPIATSPGYQYAWYVDDVVQTETGPSFTFQPGASSSTVKVVIRDDTALVRNDPNAILEDTRSWTVQGGGTSMCAVGLCDLSSSCAADGGCDRVYKADGALCSPPTCSNGTKTWAGTCDGQGGCTGPGGSQSCGVFTCDDSGSDCRTQCAVNAHCKSGYQCVNEACVPLSVDAGTPDAGTSSQADAGTQTDAGTNVGNDAGVSRPPPIVKDGASNIIGPPATTGCGCSGAEGLFPFATLGLGLLLMRRRRVS